MIFKIGDFMNTPVSFRLDNVAILRGINLKEPLQDLRFDYEKLGRNLARGSQPIKQILQIIRS